MEAPGKTVRPAAAGPSGTVDGAELERAARALLEVSVAAVGELEEAVGPGHLRALQVLERLGRVQVGEFAAALALLPSTASRLSDRLTAAGLITRQVSPANRRATLLELTPTGRRMLEELASARVRALWEVAARMSEGDRAALLRGVRAFAAAAAQPGEAPR